MSGEYFWNSANERYRKDVVIIIIKLYCRRVAIAALLQCKYN